ncbi:hypothetical protein N7478_000960 [Penicillium angulare]|uniref:uncharacterized protein n=1 Tax=Penicillium angulare TaxID=116970 RepID=UPI00253F659D|nr:uncharacterized protein N7478_000960 [Penicillium angulare]KAJ5291709.1 hypothetical protein N7478_000960 [Penicillium angulare]
MTTSILDIPPELLSHIASYVTSLQSLKNIASLDRRLYAIFNPLLYRRDARSDRSQAIDWAAKNGDMRILSKALDHGAKIPGPCKAKVKYHAERRQRYGVKISRYFEYKVSHPLCITAETGNKDIMEFLISKGCDPNMRNSENLSVLSIAVVHGHLHLVQVLLASGANQFGSDFPDKYNTPQENYALQIAAHLGNSQIFDLLLTHDPYKIRNAADLWCSLECAFRAKHYGIIPPLVECGVCLNSCFSEGFQTPLSLAVESGDCNLVKFLLDSGADPSFTILSQWDSYGRPATSVGWKGETALSKAVIRRDEAMVQLLMEGSDRITRTRALSLSMDQLDARISNIILSQGGAVEFENQDYRRYPHYRNQEGADYDMINPIVRAINSGNVDMVRLLVSEKGASVNVWYQGLYHSQSSRSEGSAFQLAIDLGHIDIIHFLRGHGAQEGGYGSYWTTIFALSLTD